MTKNNYATIQIAVPKAKLLGDPDMEKCRCPLVLSTEIIVVPALHRDFSSRLPGLGALAEPQHPFDGFTSTAIIPIIAAMIIGAGLDKTGLMRRVAALILRYGGSSAARIVPIISGTLGAISSFMQNVGAVALFLPVVRRISGRTDLPLSRLLMPMGVCAILGGTMTMGGASPPILLDDLIVTANAGQRWSRDFGPVAKL